MAHLFQNTAAADADPNCREAMLSNRVLGWSVLHRKDVHGIYVENSSLLL